VRAGRDRRGEATCRPTGIDTKDERERFESLLEESSSYQALRLSTQLFTTGISTHFHLYQSRLAPRLNTTCSLLQPSKEQSSSSTTTHDVANDGLTDSHAYHGQTTLLLLGSPTSSSASINDTRTHVHVQAVAWCALTAGRLGPHHAGEGSQCLDVSERHLLSSRTLRSSLTWLFRLCLGTFAS
jgi:hypothetical protein